MADNGNNYSFVRATSNVDATPIQPILDTIKGKPFGTVGNPSKDGVAVNIDTHSKKTWADWIKVAPRLAEFTFQAGDIPSYLSLGCEDTAHQASKTKGRTTGMAGAAWGIK